MNLYEEKYNEILEWARKNKARLNGVPIEEVLPELAESEDERIRKWILEKVQGYAASGIPCSDEIKMADKVIDYLEKQKEHALVEPEFKIPDWVHGNWDDEYMINTVIGRYSLHAEVARKRGDTHDYNLSKSMENWLRSVVKPLIVEKQKERCLLTKEEEYILHRIIEYLEDETCPSEWINLLHDIYCLPYKKYEEQKPAEVDESTKRLNDNWMKQHFDDYKGWNKATINGEPIPTENQSVDIPLTEWSEEDEKLFWGLTAYVPNEELERLGVTRNDILKKLKSIRHQPIQIKEAYKEGFQTARHATALAFMNYCDKIRLNGKMCLSNGECEEIRKHFLVGDWEKIERYLRKYSWKPSEEQMKAMSYFVRKHQATANRTTTKWPEFEAFKSLYNDLKKL